MKISAIPKVWRGYTYSEAEYEMLLINRFYVVQRINLETNERALEIVSDARLKKHPVRVYQDEITGQYVGIQG